MILQVLFWISFSLLAWTFAGYPLTVLLLSRFLAKPWQNAEFRGAVSMIIAAHNEQTVIREKVENCLGLDFGMADPEIIIVSDGSTDGTNAILQEYSERSPMLRMVEYQPRAGKANALNVGVSHARGEVLVFGDANVMVGAGSCQALLAPFADSAVGAVCGRVLVRARGDQEIAGESLYMRYEAVVQRAEAMLHSMVGVDGALFAIRRDLFRPLPQGIVLDDFMLSMQAPAARLRIVYAKEAEAVEEVVPSAKNEFKRKARIVAGGYQFLGPLRAKRSDAESGNVVCPLLAQDPALACPLLLADSLGRQHSPLRHRELSLVIGRAVRLLSIGRARFRNRESAANVPDLPALLFCRRQCRCLSGVLSLLGDQRARTLGEGRKVDVALAVHNADDLSSGGVGEPGVKDVCVCILAYNEQKHIADTIRAVSTGNGDAAFDIIVYANGCTDNTADVVRARMPRPSRISVCANWRRHPNRTPGTRLLRKMTLLFSSFQTATCVPSRGASSCCGAASKNIPISRSSARSSGRTRAG